MLPCLNPEGDGSGSEGARVRGSGGKQLPGSDRRLPGSFVREDGETDGAGSRGFFEPLYPEPLRPEQLRMRILYGNRYDTIRRQLSAVRGA